MTDITLQKISLEEYKENLRQELAKDGLYAAVKKRCDAIDEECKYMRYVQHRYIQEMLAEVMELVREESE